jgi:hypothetical protein
MAFYDFPLAENSADRLDLLRSQQHLISTLYQEITAARRNLMLLEPSEFWNSASQWAFQLCLADVMADLDFVLHYLDEARDSVRAQIQFAEAMCRA